jgi:hypothetical protein
MVLLGKEVVLHHPSQQTVAFMARLKMEWWKGGFDGNGRQIEGSAASLPVAAGEDVPVLYIEGTHNVDLKRKRGGK